MTFVNKYSIGDITNKIHLCNGNLISRIYEVSSWGFDFGFFIYNPIGFGNQLFAKSKILIYRNYIQSVLRSDVSIVFLPALQLGNIFLLKKPSYWVKRSSIALPAFSRARNVINLIRHSGIKVDTVCKGFLYVTNHLWGDFVDINSHMSARVLFKFFIDQNILAEPSEVKRKHGLCSSVSSVGVHVRRGDFRVLDDRQQVTDFNSAPSDATFFNVIAHLLRTSSVTIYTDMSARERRLWIADFSMFCAGLCVERYSITFSELTAPADVVSAMTLHKALVISPSTLSAWAAFLGTMPVYSFSNQYPATLAEAISERYFYGDMGLDRFLRLCSSP